MSQRRKNRIHKFSAKYRPFTPLILKNMNLKINQYERVGIIGKTGSGKTILFLESLKDLKEKY